MNTHLLQEVVTIFCLAIVVLLLCHRFRIPSVVGFLVTGILCGPYGAGFIESAVDVQMFASIGVVFLLFSVGLEFSLRQLLQNKRYFLAAGALQLFFTIAAGYAIAQLLGRPSAESIYLGFLLSLSSTAIVIHVLDQRHELHTPHGKLSLGILIFQDIAAVVMMLVTPFLAGKSMEVQPFFVGIFVIALVFLAGLKLVPKLMHLVAKTKSRELFLLCTLSICFLVAWLADRAGLSLPLGAFLAGLIVSESEYGTEAVEDIIPFQDVFLSLFFVSIGMLLDIHFFFQQIGLILLVSAGVLLMKMTIAGVSALLIGASLRLAILVAFSICQIGEFSFVLAKAGMEYNLGSDFNFQLFLAVAVCTMAVTPTLIHYAPKIAAQSHHVPLPDRVHRGSVMLEDELLFRQEGHVVIVGLGVVGHLIRNACLQADIPYIAVEIDPGIVHLEKIRGEPVVLGDAAHHTVLRHANIQKAKLIVILVNDPTTTMHIIDHTRKLNEEGYIIVRIPWKRDVQSLLDRGVNEVVTDEQVAADEIFKRIMKYHVTIS